jgi:L-alanine-DL-glutamate epimerase-like enolase superfamily enzyme
MADSPESFVNTASRPSDLRITDMRTVTIGNCSIIKIYTNQEIYGLGEVRDGATKEFALTLKSRILGENPCNIDLIFRKIKQFGHHARQAGGVCAVEMALMDLAGKAYGVPAYQLAGGKFRDKVRIYCDTTTSRDAEEMGHRLKERMDMGFTFLKMDVGIGLLRDIPGTLAAPSGMLETSTVMHPFTGIRLTDKGIGVLSEYVSVVRGIVGYEIPLAADHFGHIGVEDCIRLGKALDKYNLAWYEDMIPWQFTDQYLRLKNACDTPICTGEDIYLKDGFKDLFEQQAISVCHPDLATSGGILETKKIGDLAQEHGIAMAMHMAAMPIAQMASVHCAAATENFVVLENHYVDVPWWNDIVSGLPDTIIQDGYMMVTEAPGLGIELNDEAVKEHISDKDPGFFEPTDAWNDVRSHDRLWS